MDDSGNFVSEWFGHRVYPEVKRSPVALADQEAGKCPFLTSVTSEERKCVKTAAALGVCTISSRSNGPRQDWLVCPYRALDDSLLGDVINSLFGQAEKHERVAIPAPTLIQSKFREKVIKALARGGNAIIYFQDKLGGEISISKTDRSPELSFDITLVEVKGRTGEPRIASYGILEVQTMDFHGSYRRAVQNLQDALRLHRANFHDALKQNPNWLGEKIEGPNIANVFKRTFYQMMLKFQIGAQQGCAGTILAIPESVWDSWQRHLAKPELIERPNGTFILKKPSDPIDAIEKPSWIYIFDIPQDSEKTPSAPIIRKRIATSADVLAHYALKAAPEIAVGTEGTVNLIPQTIKQRLATWWPEFSESIEIEQNRKV